MVDSASAYEGTQNPRLAVPGRAPGGDQATQVRPSGHAASDVSHHGAQHNALSLQALSSWGGIAVQPGAQKAGNRSLLTGSGVSGRRHTVTPAEDGPGSSR